MSYADFKQVFDSIWEFFNIESPFFGLTFKEIYLGVFAVGVSVLVYQLFFFGSLGSSVVDSVSSDLKSGYNYWKGGERNYVLKRNYHLPPPSYYRNVGNGAYFVSKPKFKK